jgi:hypothetical protein
MPLIAQRLTTLANVRSYLNLYTLTSVTSSETLSATSTARLTFQFANTDLAPNYFGAFAEASGTASDTVSTAVMTIDYSLGTVTFSATRTGDITCTSYKYFAWDYSKDKLLERNINSVSGMVSKYCNRNFIADTYTEYYKGHGRQKLILNQYPVNAITSVKVDSAALTAGTDYVTADQTYLDQGIIFKNNGWTWCGYLTGLVGEPTAPVDNIEVVYSAGYTLEPEASRTLPYDLEDVCISMVADLYNEQQKGAVGLKRLTEGKLTYEWDSNPLLQQHASILNAYKKVIC